MQWNKNVIRAHKQLGFRTASFTQLAFSPEDILTYHNRKNTCVKNKTDYRWIWCSCCSPGIVHAGWPSRLTATFELNSAIVNVRDTAILLLQYDKSKCLLKKAFAPVYIFKLNLLDSQKLLRSSWRISWWFGRRVLLHSFVCKGFYLWIANMTDSPATAADHPFQHTH